MGRKSRAKRERKKMDPQQLKARKVAEKAARSEPPGEPVMVSDATFDSAVLKSDLPVLVDFWAPWCGPCKMVAPVLDQLAAEMKGSLKIAKYNTEKNQRVAQMMNVRSIPTMVLFRDGEVVDIQIGAMQAGRLRSWVEKRISPKQGLWNRILGRGEAPAQTGP